MDIPIESYWILLKNSQNFPLCDCCDNIDQNRVPNIPAQLNLIFPYLVSNLNPKTPFREIATFPSQTQQNHNKFRLITKNQPQRKDIFDKRAISSFRVSESLIKCAKINVFVGFWWVCLYVHLNFWTPKKVGLDFKQSESTKHHFF